MVALGKGGVMNRVHATVRMGVDKAVTKMGDKAPEMLVSETGRETATGLVLWAMMMTEELDVPHIPKRHLVAQAGELGLMKTGDVGVQGIVDWVWSEFGEIILMVWGSVTDEMENYNDNQLGADPPDFAEKARELESEKVAEKVKR